MLWPRWHYVESIHTSTVCTHEARWKRTFKDMSVAQTATDVTSHKEERTARIRADGADREETREMLQSSVDPMDPTDHPWNRVEQY